MFLNLSSYTKFYEERGSDFFFYNSNLCEGIVFKVYIIKEIKDKAT